jgi:hypothetical protein
MEVRKAVIVELTPDDTPGITWKPFRNITGKLYQPVRLKVSFYQTHTNWPLGGKEARSGSVEAQGLRLKDDGTPTRAQATIALFIFEDQPEWVIRTLELARKASGLFD